jgi:endonuclease/exonuclease/phosphatase family metal-dependent hydrolase
MMTIPEIYQEVSPSVVMILAGSDSPMALGTGIIMSEDGYIITNAHIVAEFENIIVGCTHLALNQEDRASSMEIICSAMQEYKKPVILAGDMNSHATDKEQVILNEKFTTLNNPQDATYPSIEANECIDYIYAAKEGNYIYKVKESRVFSEDSIVSDHLPIFVKIAINKKQ